MNPSSSETTPVVDNDIADAVRAEGRAAFERRGEAGESECRYPLRHPLRTQWYVGFLDARTKARLAKHGIEYP